MRHDMTSYLLVQGIIVDCSCGWRRQMPLGAPAMRQVRIDDAMNEHITALPSATVHPFPKVKHAHPVTTD